MTLIVENKDITSSFIPYLKKRMLGYFTTILEPRKLDIYDDYFKLDKFSISGVEINSRKVLLLGMTHLTHKRYETYTSIFIDPNILYPGTHFAIIDLCKVINFGTLSIDAYPILSDTFNYFSRNISKYIDKSTMGLG